MIKYKDLNLNLTVHPNTGDLVYNEGVQAVKKSVINILNTMTGERAFNSDFGAGLYNLLFEPVSMLTALQIQQTIGESLTIYEPRIKILTIKVIPSHDNDSYNVLLECFIYGMKQEATIKFYLERIR